MLSVGCWGPHQAHQRCPEPSDSIRRGSRCYQTIELSSQKNKKGEVVTKYATIPNPGLSREYRTGSLSLPISSVLRDCSERMRNALPFLFLPEDFLSPTSHPASADDGTTATRKTQTQPHRQRTKNIARGSSCESARTLLVSTKQIRTAPPLLGLPYMRQRQQTDHSVIAKSHTHTRTFVRG